MISSVGRGASEELIRDLEERVSLLVSNVKERRQSLREICAELKCGRTSLSREEVTETVRDASDAIRLCATRLRSDFGNVLRSILSHRPLKEEDKGLAGTLLSDFRGMEGVETKMHLLLEALGELEAEADEVLKTFAH